MPSQLHRGIDHIVCVVRDLDAGRELYKTLGFTTIPRADHPFGTSNSLIQFDGNFIELLAVTNPAKLPPADGRYSFGRYNAGFLEKREGMTTLVFASGDARRDLTEFQASKLTTQGPLDFKRNATQPDGSEKTVSFSLAFVTDERLPDAAFFVCQQHEPENFWKHEYQRHANSAKQIAEVVMVAPDPAALVGLYGGLQGPEQVHAERGGLRIETARGEVSVLTPAAFGARFPGNTFAADGAATQSPRFAAVRVAIPTVRKVAEMLRAAGVAHQSTRDQIWIDAATMGGYVLELGGSETAR